MKAVRGFVLLLMAGLLAAPSMAAVAELGMDAPPLKISEWVKGKPVDLKGGKGKNVYVVEFWATWCGPCKRSIPHLTKLQKKYADKNVVFVGVTNEVAKTDKVREFVKGQGDAMDYVVAIDTAPDSAAAKGGAARAERTLTYDAYLGAFDIDGIPTAFIVDKDGKIAYVGSPAMPSDKFEESLDAIVNGKWDLAAARKANNDKRAAVRAMAAYFAAVRDAQAADSARNAAEDFMRLAGKDAVTLNDFAWTLLTTPGIKDRDMELAIRVAKAAYDACDGKDPAIVDTYARALFDTGKVSEALKYQQKAVELCGSDADPEVAKELKETLKKYEAAQKKE